MTFCVQRLCKPREAKGPLSKAHRVFGGGMLGLTEDQWDILDEVFEIDYMGAAEFEFGAFPRAMRKLISAAEKVAFAIAIDRKDVVPNRLRKPLPKKGRKKDVQEPATLYIVCAASEREYAESTVRRIVAGEMELCRDIGIDAALDPIVEFDRNAVGWFDLDTAFFFFSDKLMWQGVCSWFGLEAK